MISCSLETGETNCDSDAFEPDRTLSSASSDVESDFGKTKDFSKYSNRLVSIIDPLNFGSGSFVELDSFAGSLLSFGLFLLSETSSGTFGDFGTGGFRAGLAQRWNSFCLFKLLPEDGAGAIGVTVTRGTVQITGSVATGDKKGGVCVANSRNERGLSSPHWFSF